MRKTLLLLMIAVFVILEGCTISKNRNQQPLLDRNKTVVSPTITPAPTLTVSGGMVDLQVPPLNAEDVIRTFFNFVDRKKIAEAIGMTDKSMVVDELAKQAWNDRLSSFDSVLIKSMESCEVEGCSCNEQKYKVVLEVKMIPAAAKAAIPFYGWTNGENIRWIILHKDENDFWKITEIATGP